MPVPRLTPCPTCGQQIATTAPSCPKCGMPDPGCAEREVDIEVERLNRLDDPPIAARRRAAAPAKQSGDPKSATQVIAVLLFLFLACSICGSCYDNDDATSTATPAPAPLYNPVADSLAEARDYAEAQALPASNLEGNRDAYAELATTYPANPEYARKRDQYVARIVERDRPRPLRAYRPQSAGGSRYITGPRGGCYYLTASGNKEYVDRSLCN